MIKENDIDYDDLKTFILFKIYYQEMMCLLDDVKDINIIDIINNLMDYHYEKVYGKYYNDNYMDITCEQYKCIVTFE